MSGFRIFDSALESDVREWLEMWHESPAGEVFAHPEYVRLYSVESCRGLCAAWKSGSLRVLHPFVLRDVAGEPYWKGSAGTLFDVTSAYGYAGPFAWGDPGDRAAECFWREFRAWAMEHQVVSEFVRLNPFEQGSYPGETWPTTAHIIRSLDGDETALWMDFDHKVRKNVMKATRCGVRIEIDETGKRLDDFLRVYEHTMDRRRALKVYYFPRQFFERMHQQLAGQFAYFHALVDGQVVSTELVLVSKRSVYSFLGGTLENSFRERPNDLLKFAIMKWAKRQAKAHFVLGGGNRGEDGIYRYKRAFAPRGETPYRLGGQIFSKELYDALMDGRQRFEQERGQAWVPTQGFFPAYRS